MRQKLETRGLFRRRICFRSFLLCQNPLNRHVGQNMICVCRKSSFPVFPPIGPPYKMKQTHGIQTTGGGWHPGSHSGCGTLGGAWKPRDPKGNKLENWIFEQKHIFCRIWRLSGFWHHRMERKDALRRNRPRVSNFLSHRIVGFLKSMIFDILAKSLHPQVILGPSDGSLDLF